VGGMNGTALATAVFWGKGDMVLLLLDRGADINVGGGMYGTALATAVFEGKGDMVSLLLDGGAKIQQVGGEYGTALAAAASQGEKDIALQLLRWEEPYKWFAQVPIDKADINAIGGTYGTALTAAAYHGKKSMVSLLLAQKADLHLVAGTCGTALAAAASQRWSDVVSILLAAGADLHVVRGIEGTTLAIAAALGSQAIGDEATTSTGNHDARGWKLLSQLDELDWAGGAVGGKYGSALGLAVYFGDMETVSLLLNHGVDATRVGGAYRTHSGLYPDALDAATAEGSASSPSLRELLANSIHNHSGEVLITQSPFPMPYSEPVPRRLLGTRSSTAATILHKATAAVILSPILCDALHTGIIDLEQAEVLCSKVDEQTLIRLLVRLVGLRPNTADRLQRWIQGDVQYFIARDLDFGFAYAAARVAWKNFNEDGINDDSISIQRERWHYYAKQLDNERSRAIHVSGPEDSGLIKSPYSIMPRRIWDVRSNRVVEFRMLHAAHLSMQPKPNADSTRPTYWAVSHSWTEDRDSIETSINQYLWPIPLPKNLDLNSQLRDELLRFGAEYIWLDVLCLRQQRAKADAELDQLKQDEWKLDVPTIGNIYRAAERVVRYFNGLGIPFSPNGWGDTRHWLQRAWTLQEIRTEHSTINGGVIWDNSKSRVFMNTLGMVSGKITPLRRAIRPVLRLSAMVDSPQGCEVYELAREMTKRHASQPVDLLSGLFYLLRTTELPCYSETIRPEEFWTTSFRLLPAERMAEILFDFPYRGSDKQWFPTWKQMMSWPERDSDYDHISISPRLDLKFTPHGSSLVRKVWSVSSVSLYPGPTHDPREYEVKIRHKFFGFYNPYIALERININPGNKFTLVAPLLEKAYNWIVCEPVENGEGDEGLVVLKKAGVLRTDSLSELLVGGVNGGSMLKQINCEIV